jgi:hypothetical protein
MDITERKFIYFIKYRLKLIKTYKKKLIIVVKFD